MKIPSFEEWFASTSEGKEVIAANVVAGVEERQALVDEDAQIESELLKARVAPQKKIATATSEVEKATKALADVQLVLQRERVALQSIEHQASTRKAQIETMLREGAASSVVEFLESISGLWDSERRQWRWSAPTHNGESMPAGVRISQIRGIQKRAEALLFEPDAEIAERELVVLRDELADPLAAAA